MLREFCVYRFCEQRIIRLLKSPTDSDRLRTNGDRIEVTEKFPFMLRLAEAFFDAFSAPGYSTISQIQRGMKS
jgi:hypothetical protein